MPPTLDSAAKPDAIPLQHLGVGIDTARYGHRVSFLRPDRQPAAKPLTVLESQEGYQALQQQLEALQQRHPQAQLHIRIDAAGQYAANLEHFLRTLNLPLVLSIGEPKRNKDYQKAHFPKRTTDDTESQAMARFAVVELPEPTRAVTPEMDLLRQVAGRLQAQIKQSTQAINRLHNLLARVFPELALFAENFSAGWVLQLLDKYPSAQRIAQAHLASLQAISYIPQEKVQALHQAAKQSVASLKGAVAENLLQGLVTEVRHSQRVEENMRALLIAAHKDLPPSGHLQLATIIGFGEATAAVLTAFIVDIDRFATPDHLVGYFGVFPEENTSGVDKFGKPIPPGAMHMSSKGNDLVRAYLFNATKSALQHNPAIRALYRRLRAKGKRGDVAFGHCMRKLLHLAFAVWKTNRPFDKNYYPWEPADQPSPKAQQAGPTDVPDTPVSPTPTAGMPRSPTMAADTPASPTATANVPNAPATSATLRPSTSENEKAVGHKRDVPAQKVVTTADSSLETTPTLVNPPATPKAAFPATPPTMNPRPSIDFAFLREQISLEQVLRHLGGFELLKGASFQRRGPCPLHGQPGDSGRTFSAHLGKNLFRCFHPCCAAMGNVLDFWAAHKNLPPYEAALDLAATFRLPRNREEEPVEGTRRSYDPA